MSGIAAATAGVLALLALYSGPVRAQATYPNLWVAIQGQNLTGLATLVGVAKLEPVLSNPNLTATLFAPSNPAAAAAGAALASARLNLTQILPILLQYHLVPNNSINFRDGLILPTALGNVNITNTTKTLTMLKYSSNTTWYLGGIIEGAVFNTSSRVKAGRSELYIVDSVLVPPSALFGYPLTIRDYLTRNPQFSILSALVGKDSVMSEAFSNPNLAVTFFAPTDAAFNAFFQANNLTLAQASGSATTSRILLNHVYPDFPETINGFPVGTVTVRSPGNDTIAITKAPGPAGAVTVRGAGNNASIPIISPDNVGGMSSVHVISGVILPSSSAKK